MNLILQAYLNNLRDRVGRTAYEEYNWKAYEKYMIVRWFEVRRDGSGIKDVRYTDVFEYAAIDFLDKIEILFSNLKKCKEFSLNNDEIFEIIDDIADLIKNNRFSMVEGKKPVIYN